MITSWNPAATMLYGYSAEEAIGQPVSILIPNDHAGEEREILQRLLDGGHVDHYETERLRKDGSRVTVALTVSPIPSSDGSISGASVIARDISEQRRNADRAARPAAADHRTGEDRRPRGGGERRPAGGAAGAERRWGAVGLLDEGGETIRVAGYSGYSETSLANWETFSVEADASDVRGRADRKGGLGGGQGRDRQPLPGACGNRDQVRLPGDCPALGARAGSSAPSR